MRILLALILTVSVFGCKAMEENTRKIEDLQHQLAEMQARSKKDQKELTEARQKVREQSKKLALLNKKIGTNKDNIEELKITALELQAPSDLKVVKLADESSAVPKPIVLSEPKKEPVAAPKKLDVKDVERAKKLEKIKKLKAAAEERKKKAPKGTPVKVASIGPIKDTQKYYNQGLDLFYAGKHAEARAIFNRIIESYPKHSLADNALYWSGETYYSEDNFDKALAQFDQLVTKYPKSNKAPDALLKAGYTYIVINEAGKAKEKFQKLISSYPDSGAAKKAKKQLKTLK